MEEVFQAIADVRIGLYGSPLEKLKELAKVSIPLFSLEGVSRAKVTAENLRHIT